MTKLFFTEAAVAPRKGLKLRKSASSKPTTEFAQPRLSRSNSGHPQREGTNSGVLLPIYGWYYPSVRLQIWVCLICVISPYSNRIVQIRVGLELAEETGQILFQKPEGQRHAN